MNNGRKALLALVAGAWLALPVATQAAERGDFQLRGRVIGIVPDDDSGEISGVAGSGVSVDSAATLELDATFFLHSNVAIEVIAAAAKHDINGTGSAAALGRVADTGVLPPTVTLQYRWNTDGKVQPYIGGGFNYTIFFDEDTTPSLDGFLGTPARVSLDESFGWAAQFGVDFRIKENWYFNFDLKYLDVDTTAVISDAATGVELARVDVDINPWVPGIGFGYRW